ncbi:MAG TPA: hypothetical protein VNW50_14680 [Streptosporangiaceae bacterium]|jgi:hypothetical protein|nr:hypothetical protein [Streptosporangiaceae bacterium]
MIDVRDCEQCGARFTPRREHARFCSARCRVAWNRADRSQPAADESALAWAIAAMSDAVARLPRVAGLDRPRAFAVVSEAVWWVTIVDANLVRYHPDLYDCELASRPEVERLLIEETLAGLRFVRNQVGNEIDRGYFIQPGSVAAGSGRAQDWAWTPLPEPSCESLSPRGLAWEMERYRAYESRLAGRAVVATFSCASSFLNVVAAGMATPADVSNHD